MVLNKFWHLCSTQPTILQQYTLALDTLIGSWKPSKLSCKNSGSLEKLAQNLSNC
jgi:hypothetical protein